MWLGGARLSIHYACSTDASSVFLSYRLSEIYTSPALLGFWAPQTTSLMNFAPLDVEQKSLAIDVTVPGRDGTGPSGVSSFMFAVHVDLCLKIFMTVERDLGEAWFVSLSLSLQPRVVPQHVFRGDGRRQKSWYGSGGWRTADMALVCRKTRWGCTGLRMQS